MYRHHDLISVFALNKMDARNKVSEFLFCYKKNKVSIIAVEGTNNHYEVEVQYNDDYEETSIFPSEDFIEQPKPQPITLQYKY